MATIKKYLELRDDLWRGLGKIPMSGFGIRKEYAKYDAEVKFGLTFPEKEGNTACRCGEVIQGRMSPQECPLFGTVCVPEDPVGPCMVSSEGACAAAYKYQGV
jgi:hydrogenase expression/formation protein HypD